MKKIKFWSIQWLMFVGLFSFAIISCKPDDDPYLKVSVSSMDFSSKGESQVFSIESNVAWTITGHQSWVTVTPTTGKNNQTVNVVVKENVTRENNQCTMTVSVEKGALSHSIAIIQKPSDAKLTVDNNNIYFASEKGDSKNLMISSNGSWKIQNIPIWLRASSTNGNGNSTITFTTTAVNLSSSAKEDSITIISDEVSVSVIVTQEGGAAKNCKVIPNHKTILDNGIAFDLLYESDVVKYRCGWMEASQVDYLSEAEIIDTLENNVDLILKTSDYIPNNSGLSPGTTYVVYTLGYNKNGERGDLVKTTFTTNNLRNNEPAAWISTISYSETNWYWTITKSATCFSYYMMSTENFDMAFASDALQAYWIDDAIRNDATAEYVNDGDWQMYRYSSMMAVWTRGVDVKGNKSNDLEWDLGIAMDESEIVQKSKVAVKSSSMEFLYGKKPNKDEYKFYIMK